MPTAANHANHSAFITRALSLAGTSSADGTHGPFGAVVVCNGAIIGEGFNSVIANCDPTAHAEIIAIRQAAKALGTHDLSTCTLYASCEPCPMCLAAVYWAHIKTVYYAATQLDAQAAGFDDRRIHQHICGDRNKGAALIQLSHPDACEPLTQWTANPKHQPY